MQYPRKTTNTRRFAGVAMMASLAFFAAVSPAAAAPSLTELDRNALILIAAFGVLLLAIVFEVWRVTLKDNSPLDGGRTPADHKLAGKRLQQ